MFDGGHGIALHEMQGNRASSRGEGVISWFSSSCGRNLGYILHLRRGWHFKTHACSAMSGLLSSYKVCLRHLFEAWQSNRDASRGEAGDPVSLSSCHRDIGFPINFQEESVIITVRNIELRVPLEVSEKCEAS